MAVGLWLRVQVQQRCVEGQQAHQGEQIKLIDLSHPQACVCECKCSTAPTSLQLLLLMAGAMLDIVLRVNGVAAARIAASGGATHLQCAFPLLLVVYPRTCMFIKDSYAASPSSLKPERCHHWCALQDMHSAWEGFDAQQMEADLAQLPS